MELTLRDWMVIVGVLLILAVLLDAGRRILRERRAEVRLKLSRSAQRELEPEELGVSVPRVVPRDSTSSPTPRSGQTALATADDTPSGDTDGRPHETVAGAVQESERERGSTRERGTRRSRRRAVQASRREPVLSVGSVPAEGSAPAPQTEPEPPEPENLDWLDALDAEPENSGQDAEAGKLPRGIDPEVFMLNVISRRAEGFAGEDILHILLACDLRFGDMSFFHRHEQEAGRGPIQFSVANMLRPGVFDIDNMADFRTQGLTFFLTLPGPQNMMRAFDYMLETAQTVARNLDGDVLDETRSALTRQTLEHHRQRIRDLERRMLLAQPPR